MTASDETGWEFGTVERRYSNTGLTTDGRETVVAWDIAGVSPGSTALKPDEVRHETLRFAVGRKEARLFTLRARLTSHFTPSAGTFAREGPSTPMAAASVTLPGDRHP